MSGVDDDGLWQSGIVPWWGSLRLRIALAVAVVSLVVSGAVGVVLAQRSASEATEALRDQALGRLAVVADGYSLDGRLRDGAVLDEAHAPSSVRQQLADSSQHKQVSYYDGQRMWASSRVGPNVVLTIALDASTLTAQNRTRIVTLGWALAAAAVMSVALGWAAGSRLSRRLRSAASASRQIAQGDMSVHAAQPGHDEVTELTRAVDAMAASLQQRLEAEQDFTSDVAHELRTPLTGLVSAAELLPDGLEANLVRTQVTRLRRLVEDLLEISRLDRKVEPVRLRSGNLGQCIRDSLDRLGPSIVPAGVHVEVKDCDMVSLEDRRLDRVLSNLLVNLGRHGGGSGVLTVSGWRVDLVDNGPGYPDDLVKHGPRPFHAIGATKGSGLGLMIATKQAAAIGASLTFGQAPHGGARTIIQFTAAAAPTADTR